VITPRRSAAAIVLALLLGAVGIPPAAQAAVQADVRLFFDALAPYGVWTQNVKLGWVWAPSGVAPDWRPYTVGHWAYADTVGWTWVSDEPFGWATYHYGRWLDDPELGWLWVPGAVWGPAWVDWQMGDDVLGWAPMPPGGGTGLGMDFELGIDPDLVPPPEDYVFVSQQDFTSARIVDHVLANGRNSEYLKTTHRVTRYETVNGVVVNRSVTVYAVEQRLHRTIPHLKLTDVDSPRGLSGRRGGDQLAVYRPAIDGATLRTLSPDRRFVPAVTADQLRARHRRELDRLAEDPAEVAKLEQRQAAERKALEQRAELRRRQLESRQRLENDLLPGRGGHPGHARRG
jgi:hypothetical protein